MGESRPWLLVKTEAAIGGGPDKALAMGWRAQQSNCSGSFSHMRC